MIGRRANARRMNDAYPRTAARWILLCACLTVAAAVAVSLTHMGSSDPSGPNHLSIRSPKPTAGQYSLADRRPDASQPPAIDTSAHVAQLATTFVTTWIAHASDRSAWWASVRPMLTPSMARHLRDVDPVQLGASTVVGQATLISLRSDGATVRVPTDVGSMFVWLDMPSGLVDGAFEAPW